MRAAICFESRVIAYNALLCLPVTIIHCFSTALLVISSCLCLGIYIVNCFVLGAPTYLGHLLCRIKILVSIPHLCQRVAKTCPAAMGYSFIDHVMESYVQASVIIGCGRKQSGGYLDGAAPDGLMGLGPGNVSVSSLLAKAGLIQNSFSICLDETGSGRIYFGDKGIPSQQSTPFLPIGGN
ncbi:hypothetical protein F3Y22_tig00110174pilonHSYRG00416 [Hibiscus syriacus]|uniref:Xylanase inhibitor N-terminal domain-containing protein n=1 Tax=Hibiscus syriacus TaxID=106335 RepID=A0A6A3BK45_HIBSY|nr:hypothetical protein F3Y22_tig00110174pilonHSYRG00416 [Hibiscus syriacus]